MLRRLRRRVSSVFRRGLDGKDVPSLYTEDSNGFRDSAGSNTNTYTVADGVNACTVASYRGIRIHSRHTDHVQEQSHGGTTGVTPSPRTSRTVTERQIRPPAPESTSTMASTAVAPGYYRPVSASILGGLEEETQQLDAAHPAVPEGPRTTLPSIQAGSRGQGQARPIFQYRATNPAILHDFGYIFAPGPQSSQRAASDGQTRESTTTTSGSRGYGPPSQTLFSGFDEPEQPRSKERNGASHGQTSPLQPQPGGTPILSSTTAAVHSNNPYANLIEARQNAMTTNFLRSQQDLGGGELPDFPGDEHG